MERITQELELYTIPSYSSWFSWNNIHEVERFSLREFFDGSSITRSPRIYKEYRDFIISRYREDPSRKLTFTDVRKSLVGDISVLHKVFTFLEKWGLINFDGKVEDGAKTAWVDEEEESWKGRVRVEEGAPYGVRVVAAPNSMKPVVAPPMPEMDSGGGGDGGGLGFRWPPLASYSDVYGELMDQEKQGVVCGGCKEECDSSHYEYKKEDSHILCEKCFKSGKHGEDKLADDFELKENVSSKAVWTEAETLLLLESVLRHGDDWDLIAENVKTKSKLDCISKLVELPFGDLMLDSNQRKRRSCDINSDSDNFKPAEAASVETEEFTKVEDGGYELKNEDLQNGDSENQGPSVKKVRIEPTPDAGDPLMKQVARISTMVGPHVTASAAEAAVTALCYENQCSREIFDEDEDHLDVQQSPEISQPTRYTDADNSEDKRYRESGIEERSSERNTIPLNLRMRAATATALGSAAARAKLLADQEEREIEDLMASVIEAQFKKLQRKMKYFEDMEMIMEKENAQINDLEETLIGERISVLRKVFNAGMPRWREQSSMKPHTGNA